MEKKLASLHKGILKLTESAHDESKFMISFQRLMIQFMSVCENKPIISLYSIIEQSPTSARQLFMLTESGRISTLLNREHIDIEQTFGEMLCNESIITDKEKVGKNMNNVLFLMKDSNIRIYRIGSETKCWGFIVFEIEGDELDSYSTMIDMIMEIFFNFIRSEESKDETRKLENKYKEIAEMLPEIIFETDINGNITFLNRDGVYTFGLYENLNSTNIVDMFAEESKETVQDIFNECIKSKSPSVHQELYGISSMGDKFPVILRMNVAKNGVVSGTRGIMINITDRKSSEDKLKAEKSKFEGLINLIPQPVVACNCAYKIIYVNEPFVKLIGKSTYDECIGMNVGELFTDKVDFNTFKHLIKENGTIRNAEFRVLGPRGKEIIGSFSASKHSNGKEGHMICVINDITKKREIEAFSQLNSTIDKLVESNRYLADSLTKIKSVNG